MAALAASVCAILASAGTCRAQSVIISEFLADNEDGPRDEDGDRNDWIEIRNLTAVPVNLAGWHLTDNATRPAKWPFPAVTLPANGVLLVWASEKDRRNPAAPLHTNFRLNTSGEYLGLTRRTPDGVVVEHDYAPAYPPQFEDISYGMGQVTTTATLTGANLPVRYLVPASAGLEVNQGLNAANWLGISFNDASWVTGTLPLRYGRDANDPYDAFPGTDIEARLYNIRTSVYARASFTVADPATVSTLRLRMRSDDGFAACLNGNPATVADFNMPENETGTTQLWNSPSAAEHPDSVSTTWQEFVLDPRQLVKGTNVLCLHGFNRATTNNDFLLWPELLAETATPALTGQRAYFPIPTPGTINPGGTADPGPRIGDVTRNPVPPVLPPGSAAIADSQAQFAGTQGQNGWSAGYAAFASGVPASSSYTTGSFVPFAGGAASGAWNATTNHWTGTAWDLNTAAAAPWTTVAPLVVHPNDSTPGPLQAAVRRWVSTHDGPAIITGYFQRITAGTDGTTGHIFLNGTSLFSALTTGEVRAFSLPVTLRPGDIIDAVVDVGPADADGSDGTNCQLRILPAPAAPTFFSITANVARTVRPIASVTCRFRIMQQPETSLAMRDDGLGGDAVAGDGTWTCRAEITYTTPGEMLRWRIVATDDGGASVTDPPFPDPLNSPQYHGTIVDDPSTASSRLEVFHWFPVSAANAGTIAGDRGSVWHLGEFYDNVRAKLRGQSTSGFAKKSHAFDFARDQRFRYHPDRSRVRDIHLLSNWADKSKCRNTMAWETYRLGGMPALECFPIRVHQNGQFYGLYDMVEDADDIYLARAGLDPNGALYKMYNQFNATPAHASSGVEKKSRQWDTNHDLLAFLNGLNPGTNAVTSLPARRQFAYDNLDLFALANNLAITALTTNNDQGHKNYFLYRDSDGTREWKLLPWDCDLTFGRTWTGNNFAATPPQIGAAYFDDHMDSQRGLQLGPFNWIKQVAYNCPEFNRMYLRRLRTLMDQWLVGPDSTTGHFETRFSQLMDTIDPPGQSTTSDVWLDGQRWGVWWPALPWRNDNANTAATVAATAANFSTVWNRHGPRASMARIIAPDGNPVTSTLATTTNGLASNFYLSTAAYPGGTITNTTTGASLNYAAGTYPPFGGTATIQPYLKGRRQRLYDTSATRPFSDRDSNAATTNDRDFIPDAQSALPPVTIATQPDLRDANPSGGQDQEFFVIRNNGTEAVDLSGWSITGAVEFTFPGGCVIPAPDAASSLPNPELLGFLHIAKSPWHFRQRTAGPRGGQNRLVTGPYSGQLSARGETIELRNATGLLVDSFIIPAAPTPAQSSLRITELLYRPAEPLPAELATDASLQRSSFEFIELQNVGSTPLPLKDARFTEGIEFVFPDLTLAPGGRIILAANPTAFALRHPAPAAPVAGPWLGSLDDRGERLQLLDASGESVLDFSYDGSWFWPADESGHSLVILDAANTPWNDWGNPSRWGLSAQPGGNPGTTEPFPGTIYAAWQRQHFTAAEQIDPAIAGPLADPDTNGLSNLFHYASGLPPHSPADRRDPTAATETSTDGSHLTLTFRRLITAPDLAWLPEAGDDLTGWIPMGPTGTPITHSDGTQTVTFRDPIPAKSRRFARLRITLLPPPQ